MNDSRETKSERSVRTITKPPVGFKSRSRVRKRRSRRQRPAYETSRMTLCAPSKRRFETKVKLVDAHREGVSDVTSFYEAKKKLRDDARSIRDRAARDAKAQKEARKEALERARRTRTRRGRRRRRARRLCRARKRR